MRYSLTKGVSDEKPLLTCREIPKPRCAGVVMKAFQGAGYSASLGHDGFIYLETAESAVYARLQLGLIQR